MADDLTERVARALDPYPWEREKLRMYHDARMASLKDARTALAVVADDVDGIAGVLRAHQCDGEYQDAEHAQVMCSCGWGYPDKPDSDLAAHQAVMVAAYLRGADS